MFESISSFSFSSIYLISYSLTNLFADFFKFIECRLFNKNSRKSKESFCEQWDITETNWIRFLIFDEYS